MTEVAEEFLWNKEKKKSKKGARKQIQEQYVNDCTVVMAKKDKPKKNKKEKGENSHQTISETHINPRNDKAKDVKNKKKKEKGVDRNKIVKEMHTSISDENALDNSKDVTNRVKKEKGEYRYKSVDEMHFKEKKKRKRKEMGQLESNNLGLVDDSTYLEPTEHKKKKQKKDKKQRNDPLFDSVEIHTTELSGGHRMGVEVGLKIGKSTKDDVKKNKVLFQLNDDLVQQEKVTFKHKKQKGKSFDSCTEQSIKERKDGKDGFDAKTMQTEQMAEKKVFHKAKGAKRVSFSNHVEVFPSGKSCKTGVKPQEDGLVRGRRFSPEEDELIKKSVSNYLKVHGLAEDDFEKVLKVNAHPEHKGCWKRIGEALPWRPYMAVSARAHILYLRGEKRRWTQEEYDFLLRYYEKHGPNWKELGRIMGKHRFHVKDQWRRIKLPNRNKGHWSQEEYQKLFHLVNMDLWMKAFEEKKTKHGMLKDNIAWGAISDKLATRGFQSCFSKWYHQLASPMVEDGNWANSDDPLLLQKLLELDASCLEDVDWDNLLEHRSGEFCLKRWKEMAKHIGGYMEKPFPEQVEILHNRYCPSLPEPEGDGQQVVQQVTDISLAVLES